MLIFSLGSTRIRNEGAVGTPFWRGWDGDSGHRAEVGTGRQEAWRKNKEEI